MTTQPIIEFEHGNFELGTLEDELQVDACCQAMLYQYYLHLQKNGESTEYASDLAFCADFYVRDYVVDFCRQNILRPEPGLVRKFAANWYITHTLDPEIVLLERHLEAIEKFYRFLHVQHVLSKDELAIILEETGQKAYYQDRIERFLAIHGDGYVTWEAECPLKPH